MTQWVPLGDVTEHRPEVVTVRDDQTYMRCRVQLHAQGIVVRDRILGAEIKTKKQQVCRSGDFLVAEIDAKVGGFGIVPPQLEGAIVSSHYFLFTLDEERLDRRFLDLYIRTRRFRDQVAARGSTNYAAIRRDQVLRYIIPLPSLQEQERIVAASGAVLNRVSELAGRRGQSIEQAEHVLGSEAQAVFLQGRTEGWPVRTLGDFVEDVRYGTSAKANSEPNGIPVLRMGNIQDGHLDVRNLKFLQLDERSKRTLLLQRGDLLVNRTNSAELVGKCGVFDQDGEYVFASYLIRLRFDQNTVEPQYAAYYLNAPAGRAYMFANRKQMTGQANINATILRAMPMPLPPLPVQRRIVDRFRELEERIRTLRLLLTRSRAELAALREVILERLIPPGPNSGVAET
jgi:type I restriction enzyme, S subunit